MIEIKITIAKETPESVVRDALAFATRTADTVYLPPVAATSGPVLTAGVPHPLDTARVIPYLSPSLAAAPTPPPPPVPTPAEPVAYSPLSLDADGLPWDERIHSIGKVRTGDGRWRKRRNVTENVTAQVEAELRRKLQVTGAVVPAVHAPATVLTQNVVVAAPPAPPQSQEHAAAVPPPPVEGRSFDELMSLVTDIVVGGLLSEDDILAVVEQFDVKELADLAGSKPDTIARVYAALEEAAK